MKVLLNDGMDKEGIKIFEKAGIGTDTEKRDLDSGALLRDISEFDAICVRSATKVKRDIIEKGAEGNLKIIGRMGGDMIT